MNDRTLAVHAADDVSIDDLSFGNEDELERLVLRTVAACRRDPDAILPAWLRGESLRDGPRRRIYVCGSSHPHEIQSVAAVADLAGIVDDGLAASQSTWVSTLPAVYGAPCAAPVLTTAQWIGQAAREPGAVSVMLNARWEGARHFARHARQHGLRCLSPIQWLLALRRDGVATPCVGRFQFYGAGYHDEVVAHAEALLAVRRRFADPFSRLTLLNLCMHWLTHHPLYLDRISESMATRNGPGGYLLNANFLRFGDGERIVDGGAFNGDSLDAFVRALGGRVGTIWSFEPAPQAFQELKARAGALRRAYPQLADDALRPVERGLWHENTTLRFATGLHYRAAAGDVSSLSAHVVETGMMQTDAALADGAAGTSGPFTDVAVTTVDEHTGGDASFLKFEVEGSEAQALHGARRTIVQSRPKMAVAMYHRPGDLRTLPALIDSLRDDYAFGLAQHDILQPDALYLYCH